MADEGVPKTGEAIVISMTPDVCLTPRFPNLPPLGSQLFVAVPYPILARFDNTSGALETVRFNGLPAFTTASRVLSVLGNEPGSGGGVVSGVNLGFCRPSTFSPTVRSNSSFNIRNGSQLWMNCAGSDGPGNTLGRVTYLRVSPAAFISPTGEILGDTNPASHPETPSEKAWWDHGADFAKGLLWDGPTTLVSGVVGLGAGAWSLTGGWAFDAEQSRKTWDGLASGTTAAWNNPGLLWDAFSESYSRDLREGRPGEAVGRGLFDVASTIFGLKGLDKVGKVAKAGEVAEISTAVKAAGATTGAAAAAPLTSGAVAISPVVGGGLRVSGTLSMEERLIQMMAEAKEALALKITSGEVKTAEEALDFMDNKSREIAVELGRPPVLERKVVPIVDSRLFTLPEGHYVHWTLLESVYGILSQGTRPAMRPAGPIPKGLPFGNWPGFGGGMPTIPFVQGGQGVYVTTATNPNSWFFGLLHGTNPRLKDAPVRIGIVFDGSALDVQFHTYDAAVVKGANGVPAEAIKYIIQQVVNR